MRLTTACAISFVLVCAGRARADHAPTHFIAELEGGASLSGDAGPALRASLGVGGKPKHFPARFYLIGQVGGSHYAATAPRALSLRSGSEQGDFIDLALGPRMYLPIFGPLRIFAEAVFGVSYASATYSEGGRARARAYEWLLLMQLSAGLQWRVLHALSLGVRAGFAFNEAGLTGAARVAGVHDTVRPSVMAGVTWHF